MGSNRGIGLVALLGATACGYGPLPPRQCNIDMDCLQAGRYGSCLPSPLSVAQWCAFPSDDCAETHMQWGIRAGDGLAYACVGGPDAGASDAAMDATPLDGPIDAGSSDVASVDVVPLPDADVPPEMVLVEGTAFMMGCNAAVESCVYAQELPYHEVTLPTYLIDRWEVSQAAYQVCIAAGSCTAPAGFFDPVMTGALPVNSVTWDQAVDYCTWSGKRLPTEAEWELAARGTDGRTYPWGNSPPPDCTRTNSSECGSTASPVDSHPLGASPYGALNMLGNVDELCADWYAADYYSMSPATSPTGPVSGTTKVRRGLNFVVAAAGHRVAWRMDLTTTGYGSAIGFRCAKSVP